MNNNKVHTPSTYNDFRVLMNIQAAPKLTIKKTM